MHKTRAASGLAAVLTAVSGLALLAGCGGSQPTTRGGVASMPPSLILAEARATAEAAGSVHYDQAFRSPREVFSSGGDSSSSLGTTFLTTSTGQRATGLLTGGTAYLDANLAALTGYFRLPDTTASKMASRWISVRSGSAGDRQLWSEITEGMTVDSLIDLFTPAGPLTKTKQTTMDGRLVIGVGGTPPAWTGEPRGMTETLYIAAAGQPLPVSCQQIYRRDLITTTFSRWGETVHVTVPPGVTPIPAASP
jgi:hypothetical protein